MLAVGDKAPGFTLLDHEGQSVSLADLRGKKVLIWFYPKASTPGCTAEGCSLRDHYGDLTAQGVEVLGISKDSVRRQKNFVDKQGFPYRLLADEEGEVVDAFGVWGRKKFMGREFDGILRASFLIDEDGVIERVYDKVKTKTHGADVLGDLQGG